MIRTAKIDVAGREFAEVMERMAATKYENESSGSSAERGQEGLVLPVVDSLPATAGLSNLQAFQLSLKHALALLANADGARRYGKGRWSGALPLALRDTQSATRGSVRGPAAWGVETRIANCGTQREAGAG